MTAGDETASGTPTRDEGFVSVRGLRKEFGGRAAVQDLSLELRRGEMLALLGPSGCGKTTTLRMLAGLETPTQGAIRVAGEQLVGNGVSAPPEKRKMGMVFQSYALWPHMDVFENIAYPLKRRRMAKDDVRARVTEVLDLVGMQGFEARPVTNLSGGQQQRVAVARALAPRPHVLLMDEPLSNLDAVLRESMRFEIRTLQQANDITAVYVTHNQEEALAIADRVGVMSNGLLEQIGRPEELYLTPRNEFVAKFIGLANVMKATSEGMSDNGVRLRLDDGTQLEARRGHAEDEALAKGRTVSFAVRPESLRITICEDGEDVRSDPARQAIRGTVTGVTFSGNLVDYFVRGPQGSVRCQGFPPIHAKIGDVVLLDVDWRDCVALVDEPLQPSAVGH